MKCFCFRIKRLRFWRRGKNVNIKIDRIDNKINNHAKKIPIIKSDTEDIIEYVEQTNSKKKKYNFWKLLNSNE